METVYSGIFPRGGCNRYEGKQKFLDSFLTTTDEYQDLSLGLQDSDLHCRRLCTKYLQKYLLRDQLYHDHVNTRIGHISTVHFKFINKTKTITLHPQEMTFGDLFYLHLQTFQQLTSRDTTRGYVRKYLKDEFVYNGNNTIRVVGDTVWADLGLEHFLPDVK